jgi:alanyl-tRNA synthetase
MLHHTLRAGFGEHVHQMGSLVEPGRLHFDFAHYAAVPRDVLDEMEETVNARIAADDDVRWFETSFKEATERLGALAFFEDKYGDTVRVVEVGDYSRELCGGTHVGHTGRVGFVRILREGSIGSNVRRVEALTGVQGLRHVQQRLRALERAAELTRVAPEEIVDGVERLLRAQKDLQRAIEHQQRAQATGAVDELAAAARELPKGKLVVARRTEDPKTLEKLVESLRDKLAPRAVVVIGRAGDGSANLFAGVTPSLAQEGIDAAGILATAAQHIGGRASGKKPTFARGGGGKPDGLDAALRTAGAEAERLLS